MQDDNDRAQLGQLPSDPLADARPWRPAPGPAAAPSLPSAPAPAPSAPEGPDPRDLAAFSAAWAATPSAEQPPLLRGLLARVGELDTLERAALWSKLRELTKIPILDLKRAAAELRTAERGDYPAPRSGKQTIDYCTNVDAVEDLFDRLVQVLRDTGRWYARGKDVLYRAPGAAPRVVDAADLPGLIQSEAEIRYLLHEKDQDEPSFKRFGLLQGEAARAFLASPVIHKALLPLARYIRSPEWSSAWTWIGKPGYYLDEGGTYYDGPAVEPVAPGAPLTFLPRLLSGVCWLGQADMANFVAALLTALTMPHWSDGTHPALVINGNRSDAGKTTLAQVLSLLWEGDEAPTITWTSDEPELEKQLSTLCGAGHRIYLLDNVRSSREVSSAVLERSITAMIQHFRRLGHSEPITRPLNDSFYILTMNDTRLGEDLRNRSLPINLHLDGARPAGPEPKAFARAHRLEILGELAGLVRDWVERGRPHLDGPLYGKGPGWSRALRGMLADVNLSDVFLSNLESSAQAFDRRVSLLLEIAERWSDAPGLVTEWITRLVDEGFADAVGLATKRSLTPKQKEQIVSRLFRDFVGKTLRGEAGSWTLEREELTTTKGPRPGYVFRRGAL